MKDVVKEEDNDVCTVFTRCDVCLAAGCSFVNDDCVSGPTNGLSMCMFVHACVYISVMCMQYNRIKHMLYTHTHMYKLHTQNRAWGYTGIKSM